MPSLTVEGIILKRSNFGEADRMLTILTKNLGKISVVARGVRKITSRRAGNVELLNLVKVGLFKGKGYTLTEAQSVETFPRIKSNLALSTAGFHILELANKMLPENDANFRAYDLIVETLKKLEENPRQIFIRAFEVKFLTLLGFASFQLVTSEVAAVNPQVSTQSHPRGGMLHLGGVTKEMREILGKLSGSTFAEIENWDISRQKAVALERILRYYIEQILESKLKSYDVMKQLKK